MARRRAGRRLVPLFRVLEASSSLQAVTSVLVVVTRVHLVRLDLGLRSAVGERRSGCSNRPVWRRVDPYLAQRGCLRSGGSGHENATAGLMGCGSARMLPRGSSEPWRSVGECAERGRFPLDFVGQVSGSWCEALEAVGDFAQFGRCSVVERCCEG